MTIPRARLAKLKRQRGANNGLIFVRYVDAPSDAEPGSLGAFKVTGPQSATHNGRTWKQAEGELYADFVARIEREAGARGVIYIGGENAPGPGAVQGGPSLRVWIPDNRRDGPAAGAELPRAPAKPPAAELPAAEPEQAPELPPLPEPRHSPPLPEPEAPKAADKPRSGIMVGPPRKPHKWDDPYAGLWSRS